MKLTRIKGNTWVLEGDALIPLYQVGEDKCILLDSGLPLELEDIETTLREHGLTPIGILSSHAHGDHSANNAYFQEKYGIPTALTRAEQGMCSNIMTLKCYFVTLPPGIVDREFSEMLYEPSVTIPDHDCDFTFAGVTFRILQTPGHSVGHISVITPDNVCYVGDALLSRDRQNAKLPHALYHAAAFASRSKLLDTHCDYYILAHRGICPGADLPALVRDYDTLVRRRCQEILDLAVQPVSFSDLNARICAHFALLTRQPRRALRIQRNICFFVDYLVDGGFLEMSCEGGVVCYRKVKDLE